MNELAEAIRSEAGHSAHADTVSLARLVDTNRRPEVRVLLDRANSDDAYARYARASLALARGETELAIQGFVSAQSILPAVAQRLAARICLELGYIFISRRRVQTACAILEWGTGLAGPDAADVAHLRALLADQAGDYVSARIEYRAAIRSSARAFSPLTYALALANLAVALANETPEEAVELATLSLRVLSEYDLHSGLRYAIQNSLGYAQIATADFDGAERTLEAARSGAADASNRCIALWAEFNLAITEELRGSTSISAATLRNVLSLCTPDTGELAEWCAIRLRWLQLRSGIRAPDGFDSAGEAASSAALRAARSQLQAIDAALSGRLPSAREQLAVQRVRWRARGDSMSEFVTLLWIVFVEQRSSRDRAARRALREAREVSELSRLRLSTNWWHPLLIESAQTIGSGADRGWIDSLHDLPSAVPSRPTIVRLHRDGTAFVDGTVLPDDIWREGRTGSHVLRRYFQLLLARRDGRWTRDELADVLWPESDGDRAVRNLHAATHDLRRVLANFPNIRLEVTDGHYGLHLGASVSLD